MWFCFWDLLYSKATFVRHSIFPLSLLLLNQRKLSVNITSIKTTHSHSYNNLYVKCDMLWFVRKFIVYICTFVFWTFIESSIPSTNSNICCILIMYVKSLTWTWHVGCVETVCLKVICRAVLDNNMYKIVTQFYM